MQLCIFVTFQSPLPDPSLASLHKGNFVTFGFGCQSKCSDPLWALRRELQESLNSPIFTLDRGFKGETEEFVPDVYNDSEEREARLDIEEEKNSSVDISKNIINKFKYSKRFFN